MTSSQKAAMTPPAAIGIAPENYAFLQRYIADESGIVLGPSKEYLLETRLAPILERECISTINDLCALLKAAGHRPLRQQVVDAMTTNETLFFRDETAFGAVRDGVLPELIGRRRPGRSLRLWSAASSSGQEAYSLAMLLADMGLQSWDVQILGTDVSTQMVERARQGLYSMVEVSRGLPDERLRRHFRRSGAGWQVSPSLKSMVQFEQFDLRQSARRQGLFDLILCRNVLIYFDVATKGRILRALAASLAHDGYLLLGAAETAVNLDVPLRRAEVGGATFYRPAVA